MAAMFAQPWQLIVVALAGWLNWQQQDVVAYLREESRVLREQLGGKRVRLTDDQRRRLAAKAKVLGDICTLVTPETVLRWYRTLIARKYDGSAKRGVGRPGTARWETVWRLAAAGGIRSERSTSVCGQTPVRAPRIRVRWQEVGAGEVLGPYAASLTFLVHPEGRGMSG